MYRPHIFHVAYTDALMKIRAGMLADCGYVVTSALGNAKARRLASRVPPPDLVLIGFSSNFSVRADLLRWFKLHYPQIPVTVLKAHSSENFPEADCVTVSEDPEVWLAAVADCLKSR